MTLSTQRWVSRTRVRGETGVDWRSGFRAVRRHRTKEPLPDRGFHSVNPENRAARLVRIVLPKPTRRVSLDYGPGLGLGLGLGLGWAGPSSQTSVTPVERGLKPGSISRSSTGSAVSVSVWSSRVCIVPLVLVLAQHRIRRSVFRRNGLRKKWRAVLTRTDGCEGMSGSSCAGVSS